MLSPLSMSLFARFFFFFFIISFRRHDGYFPPLRAFFIIDTPPAFDYAYFAGRQLMTH